MRDIKRTISLAFPRLKKTYSLAITTQKQSAPEITGV